MSRNQQMARVLRALTGQSQRRFAKEIGVDDYNVVAQIEAGSTEPHLQYLDRMAEAAGITISAADELLRHYEALRQHRQQQLHGGEEILPAMMSRLQRHFARAYPRLLALPMPVPEPRIEDRQGVEGLLERLKGVSEEARFHLVRVAEEFQAWALCERVCEESIREAARSLEDAAAWARLAQEIAEQVRVPEGLRKRLLGYAGLHTANVLRVAGDLEESEVSFDAANRLWLAGSDPAGLLDPGRLFDLKASLCRDQRRFRAALALLDQAAAVSHAPARILIKKGFTLEILGEYERAIEALQQAAPLVEKQGDARLRNILRLNLATNYCFLGRYQEASKLADEVVPLLVEAGDRLDLVRTLGLRGRIAAGLGQTDEALRLFAEARWSFAAEGMFYDVALALLEEAILLLGQGRAAEVKALAGELSVVFEMKGVHREALAALRLFHEAAASERATAEQARRILGYLFRARHDQGLRFETS